MDDVVAAERRRLIPSTLHRRNSSTATTFVVPTKLTLPPDPHSFPPTIGISACVSVSATTSASSSATSSPQLFVPPDDFEQFIISNIKPSSSFSYTSLRDLLPSSAVSAESPTASTSSVFVIPIRNRLVKQAAWAYLQPMSSEPVSAGRSFILCLIDLITTPIAAFFRLITRSLDWILRSGRVSSR